MLDRPPLLALEYFVATASLGTVRAAANELNVTPSAISHQIGRLEGFLNVQLFHRHKRRLVLTDAGRYYVEQLEGSLNHIRQATRDVAKRDKRRHLRVSAPPTFLTFFVIPRLPKFLASEPELTLTFTDNLVFDPMHSEFDCAVEYRVQPDSRLHSEKLFDDEVVPVASPEYVEQMDIHSLADLRRCTLIETAKRVFSWNNALREFPWRNRCRMIEVQFTYQALTSVVLSQGVALANRYNAQYLISRGSLVIPFDIDTKDYFGPSYFFSCLPEKEALPPVKAFRSWLEEEISQSRP